MSMTCIEAQGELPLYVGGDLESPGRERVARHLESCPACRAALAQSARSRDVLRAEFERTASGFPGTSAWPSMRERLLAEGLIHGAAQPSISAPLRRGRLLRLVAPAAAAAALFVLGTLSGRLFPDSAGPVERDPGRASQPVVSAPVVGGPVVGGPVVGGPVVGGPASDGLGGTLEDPDGGSLAGGSLIEPVPIPARRGEVLREVQSRDDLMYNRARPYYSQPVVPFNALSPGSSGNTASLSSISEWR